MFVSDREFLLGRCLIHLVCRNKKILALLDQLLLSIQARDGGSISGDRNSFLEDIVELEVNLDTLMGEDWCAALEFAYRNGDILEQLAGEAIRSLLSRAMAEHSTYIWLDAACLVLPTGELLVLAGPSMCGKTTLVIAMYLAHRWQALSEDVMLLDRQRGRTISFVRPSSLRPDCLDLVGRAVGQPLEASPLKEWFFRPEMFVAGSRPAKISAAFMLTPVDAGRRGRISLAPQTPSELVRSLLPHSNCLRLPQAVQFLHETTVNAQCFNLVGGSLPERMEILLETARQLVR